MSRYILARCGAPVPGKFCAQMFVKSGGDTVGMVLVTWAGTMEFKRKGRSYGFFKSFEEMQDTIEAADDGT